MHSSFPFANSPCKVRATDDGQGSLVDVLANVFYTDIDGQRNGNANSNALTTLSRCCSDMQFDKHQFPGRGQQATPVAPPGVVRQVLARVIARRRMSAIAKQALIVKFDLASEELVLSAHVQIFVECESMQYIIVAFQACMPVPQFVVGPYRVDLYLQKGNVLVECDEFGHASYDRLAEVQRQDFIKAATGGVFVRYNPSAKDFSILDVIAKIVAALVKHPLTPLL